MTQYAGKNVIVTGATGAIGQKICRKLKKAGVRTLVAFVRDEGNFDLKTYNCLTQEGVTQFHKEKIDFREPDRIEQKFSHAMK